MPDNLPNDKHLLSCEIYLKSITLSASEMSEADNYAAYFYNLKFYGIWRKLKRQYNNYFTNVAIYPSLHESGARLCFYKTSKFHLAFYS